MDSLDIKLLTALNWRQTSKILYKILLLSLPQKYNSLIISHLTRFFPCQRISNLKAFLCTWPLQKVLTLFSPSQLSLSFSQPFPLHYSRFLLSLLCLNWVWIVFLAIFWKTLLSPLEHLHSPNYSCSWTGFPLTKAKIHHDLQQHLPCRGGLVHGATLCKFCLIYYNDTRQIPKCFQGRINSELIILMLPEINLAQNILRWKKPAVRYTCPKIRKQSSNKHKYWGKKTHNQYQLINNFMHKERPKLLGNLGWSIKTWATHSPSIHFSSLLCLGQ